MIKVLSKAHQRARSLCQLVGDITGVELKEMLRSEGFYLSRSTVHRWHKEYRQCDRVGCHLIRR